MIPRTVTSGKRVRLSTGLLLASLAVYAACGSDEPGGVPGEADASTGDASRPPVEPPEGSVPDAPGPSGPRVEVKRGELVIDGRPTVLFGGEVPYFRVRDKAFDAQKTHALWSDTFAKMKAANMNLVATYLPWDYHASAAGKWDFTGA